MYLVTFCDRKCYCFQYNYLSNRNFDGYFCKDISECLDIFKRHFINLADKKCKSVISFSSNYDFSKYLLIEQNDKWSLVFTPFRVTRDTYVFNCNKKRSWDYVCMVLGFRPEFLFCYLDDEPKKKYK